MFLVDSNAQNNMISANKILANNMFGIYLFSCCNNLISENIIQNSVYFGLGLSDSLNNTISDNSFVNDGLYVYKSYKNNVSNNTVNGKPLVYFENGMDIYIDEAGQVILIGCENITIMNQKINDTDIAIADTSVRSNEVVSSMTEAGNSSASATITMYNGDE